MIAAGTCSAGAIVLIRDLPRFAPGMPAKSAGWYHGPARLGTSYTSNHFVKRFFDPCRPWKLHCLGYEIVQSALPVILLVNDVEDVAGNAFFLECRKDRRQDIVISIDGAVAPLKSAAADRG